VEKGQLVLLQSLKWQRWMVTLLVLCFGAYGGAWNGGRATYLATSEMDGKAAYLAVYEPNGRNGNIEETYYNGMVEGEHKQKTWHEKWTDGK